VILTDLAEVPPAPVQVSVYVLVLTGVTVSEAEVFLAPLQAPLAVQVSAFDELQVSTLESPALIDVGEALRLTAGAGVALLDELLELLELLDELLELLELLDELPEPPPPLFPPLLMPPPPPPPPPHAASVSIKRNRTGRRFMGGLLPERQSVIVVHPLNYGVGGYRSVW
jgi:hypothetical protein